MDDGDTAESWRRKARALADREIAPVAGAMDRSDRMPGEIRGRLGEAGLLGLGIPTEWGGSGGDSRAVVAVLEELSRASAAVATMVAVQLSVVEGPIHRWGTDAQKEEFLRPLARGELLGAFALTEPGAGSDAAAISTRYTRDGAGYVLRGAKTFITNAASADLVLLFAVRDGPERIHSAFLIPKGTPGFAPGTPFDKLGIRGSETTEIALAGVALPPGRLLAQEGDGLRIALSALTGGRVGIAACALGVAQAALDLLREAALADPSDGNRTRLAQSYVEVLAARSLVERAAGLKDRGFPYVREASAAKLAASRAALNVSRRALEASGRPGGGSDHPAARLWRDARVFPIVEGTSEIQELILGRSLLDEGGTGPGPSSPP